MSDTLLRVEDLVVRFRTPDGTVTAVDGVDFDVAKGETFALVGESGCGKTVTALSILDLLPRPGAEVASGRILFEGEDLLKASPARMRRLRGDRISMIFQEPMTSLNPVFTVGYQLREAVRAHRGVSGAEARRLAVEALERVRIPDPERRCEEYPHQLSGGMKQRVMIAMALICKPDLVIADEPTTALDVTIQEEILRLLKELQREIGSAVLFITHDLGVVRQTADRVAVMYAGSIVESAPVDVLFSQPLHPYTVGLLGAVPAVGSGGEPVPIPGRLPDMRRVPAGCRFAERCPHAMPECRESRPLLEEVRPGHRIACFLVRRGASVEVRGAGRKHDTAGESSARGGSGKVPLMEVEDLRMHFPIRKGVFRRVVGWIRAVDGVSFAVRGGETLALVGESGCGKTTVGKTILRLYRPTGGRISFDGDDITRLGGMELRPYRKMIQMIFQDPYSSLDPRMNIRDVIAEGLKVHHIGKDRRERTEMVARMLEAVGMDADSMWKYPHEFSGGQRQRISIARALVVEPRFVVCDEPTSALDVSVQAQILNLLRRMQHRMGLAYMFITHDLGVVEYMADRVMVMYLGRIVEEGTVDDVFGSPAHPYTRMLLSAVPRIDRRVERKAPSCTGDVPSPASPPSGCRFHPRCPHVMDVCRKQQPSSVSLSETHAASCFLVGGE